MLLRALGLLVLVLSASKAASKPGLALVVGTLLLGWLGVRRWRGARALPGQGQPEVGADAQPEVGADAQPEVGADAQPEPELGAVSSLFRQGQVFLWSTFQGYDLAASALVRLMVTGCIRCALLYKYCESEAGGLACLSLSSLPKQSIALPISAVLLAWDMFVIYCVIKAYGSEYAQDLEQKLHHPPNQPSDGANGSGTCFTAGYLYSMYHVLLKVDRAATYAMLGFQDPAAVVRLDDPQQAAAMAGRGSCVVGSLVCTVASAPDPAHMVHGAAERPPPAWWLLLILLAVLIGIAPKNILFGNEAMLLSRLCGVTLRSRLVPSFHWLCHTPTGAAAGAVILSVVRVVGLQLVWNGLFPWLFHQLLRCKRGYFDRVQRDVVHYGRLLALWQLTFLLLAVATGGSPVNWRLFLMSDLQRERPRWQHGDGRAPGAAGGALLPQPAAGGDCLQLVPAACWRTPSGCGVRCSSCSKCWQRARLPCSVLRAANNG